MTAAGASAQREYERREERRREEVRSALWTTIPFVLVSAVIAGLLASQLSPTLGWLAAFIIAVRLGQQFWSRRQHMEAYGKGAAGERKTAKVLEKVTDYVVLHDRRIPGSRANIDHVAIGPGGIFVIETKNYRGKLRVQRDQLRIAGRDRTRMIEQAWREAVAVQSILVEEVSRLGVDVRPILCLHGAELPLGKTQLQGVRVVGGRGLSRVLRDSPGRLSGEDVQRIQQLLERALAPA